MSFFDRPGDGVGNVTSVDKSTANDVQVDIFGVVKNGPSTRADQTMEECVPQRWGEYPVIKDGKDQRNSDGLSRFRNNFDCCHHQMPAEGHPDKFDGFMIPKPNLQDAGLFVNEKSYRTSSRVRTATYDVFPRNDLYRTDEQGNFVLSQSSRDAIGKFHHKLYCIPRYAVMYPEQDSNSCPLPETTHLYDVRGVKRVRFADDHGYNLVTRPTPRDDWEQIANIAKWPRLTDDGIANQEPSSSSRESQDGTNEQQDAEMPLSTNQNINQNFPTLIPIIYNYKLPSAFHPSGVTLMETAPECPEKEEEEGNLEPSSPTSFRRPTYPVSLLSQMKDAADEMKLMNEEIQAIPRTIPLYTTDSYPNMVDKWINYPVSEKLKLDNKSLSQKNYHMEHRDPLPDVRDHTTYSKRVFFHGFNSSAFRG